MQSKRGRLIVLDGADGTGKQTQTHMLIKRLTTAGHDANALAFPQYGENIFADTVSASLTGEYGDPTKINSRLVSLAYAGDRFKAAPEIRGALRRGVISVTDRYTSASMGHQGSKFDNPRERYEFVEWLKELEFDSIRGYGIPKPDLTIILDVKPEMAKKLSEQRAGHAHAGGIQDGLEANFEHQQKTAATFLEIAAREPTWRVVDCMDETGTKILDPKEIAEKVWEVVKPYLPPIFPNHTPASDLSE